MKKSLFAIAAVGAFAGAAQAQSSVTVYGLLDVGYNGGTQTAAGPAGVTNASTIASQGNITTKTTTSGLGGNGESTSRIGFRGTEDLGGGTRAFFTAEFALATDISSVGIMASGNTSNRQTFLGLGQKGLGTASIGIQYTPIHESAAQTDAGGLNNQAGNVIYDRAGGWGSQQITAGTGNLGQNASGMATNTSYTVRTTNALILKSENISGFTFKGMVVASGKNTSTANQSTDTQGYGGGIDFAMNKLFVTAAYQTFLSEGNPGATAGATNNTATFTAGYNGAVSTPGVNARDNQTYVAASYDFGILKAFAQYVNRKITYNFNSDIYVQRSAQQIGVRGNVTKTVSAWASAGSGSINNTGSNGPKAPFTGWQIGSDYNLSKRTNLYAIYGQSQTSNRNTGLYAANGNAASNTLLGNSSFNASSYAIGVRHTF